MALLQRILKVYLYFIFHKTGPQHKKSYFPTGGLKDRVNRNTNYIFGFLTLRAIDWHIIELILRGSKGGGGPGGVGEFGGGVQNSTGPLS